jgi:hypothetical protein
MTGMRHITKVPARIIGGLLLLLLFGASTSAQSLPQELQELYSALSSSNAQDRYAARISLTTAIGQVLEPRRGDLVAELIEGFPKHDYRIQLAIAIALSKQASPWTAPDFHEHVTLLYQQFLTQSDNTLKPSIDDALANAKGYYRDAILDYNGNRVADLDATIEKFKRTAIDLPASKYVPNSVLYLAEYLTRAYFLGHPRGRDLLNESNSVLSGMPASNLSDDAAFRLALNRVLLDDRDGAISMLQEIETKYSDRDRVYVFQFFYSKNLATVVDKTFPTKDLARKMREFLERNSPISVDDQSQLIQSVAGGS